MGKGGGGPTQTTSTSNTSNIPEYAQPYVETMLGATQKQLYKTDDSGGITGFQPYKAFGGTYDASGNMTGYDPGKAIAQFTPAQQQAQRGIMSLQTPGQFADASNMTQQAALASLGAQYNPMSAGYNQVRGAQTQAAQLGYAPMSQAAMGYGQNMEAATGTAQDMQAAQLGNTPLTQAAGMEAARLTNTPLAQAAQFSGPQNVNAQNVGTQDYTGSNVSKYMNPYLQSALAPQLEEVQRQYDITGTQQKSGAAKSGAFGGSREALMAAENQRNAGIAKNQIIGQGYNQAFNNAQQQFNAQQQADLQAQQANQGANLQAGISNQNMGYNTGLQNAQLQQQVGLANQGLLGQYGLQQGQFGQAANAANQQAQNQANLANQALMGQYGLQQGQFNQAANQANQASRNQFGMANLANQQAANQANQAAQNQFGMANLANQQQSGLANQALMGQYGMQQGQFNQAANLSNQQSRNQANLANQQAQLQAQGQNIGQQQFGANYRMQGLGQAGQLSGQLAGIGGQQLAAQQGIYTAQNAVGAQQQQLRQQEINQAIQDYANAQQYPIMQLGTMSNMLRGLPMQAQTTQQYQAQANPITQGIGALGAGASLYNATKAEGGIIKAAKGGIMSYDVGGAVYSDLLEMEPEQLSKYIKETSSPRVKSMAEQILKNKTGKASGGIMRFYEGETVNLGEEVKEGEKPQGSTSYAKPSESARKPVYESGISRVQNFIKSNPDTNLMRTPLYKMFQSQNPIPNVETSNPKPAMTPDMENLLSSALAESKGSGPYPTLPNNDPKSPNYIPPNLRAPDLSGIKQAVAPAGAPPSVASSDGTGKVSKEKIDQIRKTNPELQAAMDTGRPPPAGYPDLIKLAEANAKALGVSLVDPDVKKTVDALYEEERARKDKFLGPNPAIARRAEVMKEKANIADEVKRTQAMRMAEFFAMWGSTPGNTIVAGLNALKNKVPDFIADTKEASRMRREIDKSIADLDQVDYLEKAGDLKGADAKKLAAVNKAQTWAQELSKSTVAVELAKIKEAGDVNLAHIKGGYDLKKAGIDRAGQRESTEIAKANEDYRRTQSDINNSRLKTEYVDMMKLAGREITDKTPESARAKIINAQKELAKMEKSFNDNEKRALERLNSIYKKYNYPVDEGKSEKSRASKVINLDKI